MRSRARRTRPRPASVKKSGYADVPDEMGMAVVRLAKPFTLEQLSDAVLRQVTQRKVAQEEGSFH